MVQDVEKLLITLKELEEIRGRTRFQKTIYLLMEKNGIDFSYDFIPYYYGPYSQDLQIEIDLLEAADLIDVKPVDGVLYVHRLTKKGKAAAKEIKQKMGEDEFKRLSRALNKYKIRSTKSLVSEAKSMVDLFR